MVPESIDYIDWLVDKGVSPPLFLLKVQDDIILIAKAETQQVWHGACLNHLNHGTCLDFPQLQWCAEVQNQKMSRSPPSQLKNLEVFHGIFFWGRPYRGCKQRWTFDVLICWNHVCKLTCEIRKSHIKLVDREGIHRTGWPDSDGERERGHPCGMSGFETYETCQNRQRYWYAMKYHQYWTGDFIPTPSQVVANLLIDSMYAHCSHPHSDTYMY